MQSFLLEILEFDQILEELPTLLGLPIESFLKMLFSDQTFLDEKLADLLVARMQRWRGSGLGSGFRPRTRPGLWRARRLRVLLREQYSLSTLDTLDGLTEGCRGHFHPVAATTGHQHHLVFVSQSLLTSDAKCRVRSGACQEFTSGADRSDRSDGSDKSDGAAGLPFPGGVLYDVGSKCGFRGTRREFDAPGSRSGV